MVVSLLAALPSFTYLKIGGLQAEDLVLLLLLGFCVAKFLFSGFSLRISGGLYRLFISYSLILFVVFSLAVFSLRLPLYPLQEASLLKQPVIFPLSKLLQLGAIICSFFWLADLFLKDRYYLDKAINVYWYTGLVGAWYALASCVVLGFSSGLSTSALSPLLGAYVNNSLPRARGFFNEGGPYGVYLLSVFLMGFLRRHRTQRSLGWINILILMAAFLLSASKAGFFAVAILTLYAALSTASGVKRLAILTTSTIAIGAVAMWLNVGGSLSSYVYDYQNIEEAIASRGIDPNLVMGRVAAAYIVPRMILAHPFTGIGFGNYPLMRNDPHYLGSLPAVNDTEDLPALGIPSIAAEIGIPATVCLTVLIFTPYWMSRKKAAIITISALYHPLAVILGVQLTFAYPWFISACAVASVFLERPIRSYDRSCMSSAIPLGEKERVNCSGFLNGHLDRPIL